VFLTRLLFTEVFSMTTQLTKAKQRKLAKNEAVIAANEAAFIAVGNALMDIRDDEQWRPHESFEAYLHTRWQFTRSYGYRLIGAADVVKNLSPIGDTLPLPGRESHARPLTKLEPKEQVEVWSHVVERAERDANDKPVITAQLVAATVEEWKAPEKAESGKPEAEGSIECPNCNSTERDEDGDCAKCHHPAKYWPDAADWEAASDEALVVAEAATNEAGEPEPEDETPDTETPQVASGGEETASQWEALLADDIRELGVEKVSLRLRNVLYAVTGVDYDIVEAD
jgi:hypothetical protein